MDLGVLLRRADVDPVALVDVGDERLAALDQRREVAALDRVGRVLRDAIEGLRLEDVDAGVDVVGGDLVGLRLLEEALHGAVGVGLDQAVGGRVVDRRQHDRRLGLARAVQRQHGVQVDLGQHVAVEDDDRSVEMRLGELDRAAGAERLRLDQVADRQADAAAVAEDVLDAARLVVEAEDHLVEPGDLLEQVDLVVQERAVEDRDDGLRRVERERPEPRAFTAGEEDGLHGNPGSYPIGYNRPSFRVVFLAANEPAELPHPGAHRPGPAARRGAADLVPGPPGPGPAQGDGGGADFRRRLADRLAGRLPGAAPQADHGARPAARSDRRQAADHRGVRLAGAARHGAGVDRGRRDRPRAGGHGPARRGPHPRAGDAGLGPGQAQDGGPGGRHPGVDAGVRSGGGAGPLAAPARPWRDVGGPRPGAVVGGRVLPDVRRGGLGAHRPGERCRRRARPGPPRDAARRTATTSAASASAPSPSAASASAPSPSAASPSAASASTASVSPVSGALASPRRS